MHISINCDLILFCIEKTLYYLLRVPPTDFLAKIIPCLRLPQPFVSCLPSQKCGENRKSGVLSEGHLAASTVPLPSPPRSNVAANAVPPVKGVGKGQL